MRESDRRSLHDDLLDTVHNWSQHLEVRSEGDRKVVISDYFQQFGGQWWQAQTVRELLLIRIKQDLLHGMYEEVDDFQVMIQRKVTGKGERAIQYDELVGISFRQEELMDGSEPKRMTHEEAIDLFDRR